MKDSTTECGYAGCFGLGPDINWWYPEWDMHCASAAGKLLIDHAIPNVDMHGTSASGQILIDDIPHVARDAGMSPLYSLSLQSLLATSVYLYKAVASASGQDSIFMSVDKDVASASGQSSLRRTP